MSTLSKVGPKKKPLSLRGWTKTNQAGLLLVYGPADDEFKIHGRHCHYTYLNVRLDSDRVKIELYIV